MNTDSINETDLYIARFPAATQELLQSLRAAIKKGAPEAAEVISYQMPAFSQNGILVYFAAHRNHIGFYPAGSGIENFKSEVAGFKTSKGTIQFPLDQPIPADLVERIVRFRLAENLGKQKK